MTDVWRLYDRFTREFDRDRGKTLMERRYLDAVAARLPSRASVLDLGCGSGEPIARDFIERGYAITGIDAAPAMIAICRQRFPQAIWIESDMRTLVLGRCYDAILAWDSAFHLDEEEQRAMFPVFGRHIARGGFLLFTSGPRAGVAIGELYGEELFHASLDPDEYRALLASTGLKRGLPYCRRPAMRHAYRLARPGRSSGDMTICRLRNRFPIRRTGAPN
jgi:SAM-dependent methyltransferase